MDINGVVTLDLESVNQKLSNENINRGLFFMLDSQALPDMNNYVPLKEGELRMSGHVEARDTLVWNTPYAAVQYYGKAGKSSGFKSDKQRRYFFWALKNGFITQGYTTPGTGPKWDEVAKANHMESWLNAFLIGAGLNE